MVPICKEWWCTEANEATQTHCYNLVAPAYPVWAYYAHGRQRRCQEDPVSLPPADWRRQPGRPRITWLSTVQQDLKHHHLTLPEAADLAQNRPQWRMMSTFGTTQSYSCMPETTISNDMCRGYQRTDQAWSDYLNMTEEQEADHRRFINQAARHTTAAWDLLYSIPPLPCDRVLETSKTSKQPERCFFEKLCCWARGSHMYVTCWDLDPQHGQRKKLVNNRDWWKKPTRKQTTTARTIQIW